MSFREILIKRLGERKRPQNVRIHFLAYWQSLSSQEQGQIIFGLVENPTEVGKRIRKAILGRVEADIRTQVDAILAKPSLTQAELTVIFG